MASPETGTASDSPSLVTLSYSIAGCSEHSGRYVAENIMVDCPADQGSRWSGAHQAPNVKQWMLLRLDSLSVVRSITFGKFHKPHPCNMKEFKVFLGTSPDNMIEVLHAGLKNDSIPETFSLRHINEAGIPFPARFVKIVPLSAHGQSYHTSIWFVSVSGVIEEGYVERIRTLYDEHREAMTLRHVLKHLRQRHFLTPYHALLSETNIQLEHPIVTSLYTSLVTKGEFAAVESLIQSMCDTGLFESYIHSSQPRAKWTRLKGTDPDGDVPSKRGGHAMCIDDENGVIYLLGGWDGTNNLDDFWAYDIKEDKWTILSHSTSKERNGPGRRSCHKMVFDSKTGSIYLLGRTDDGETVRASPGSSEEGDAQMTESNYCSEFFRYHTRGLDKGKWDLLSLDTASSGGPPLVFDHQMVMDPGAQVIYVFGGRVADGEDSAPKYAGLYSYNVRTSKWKLLQRPDCLSSHQPNIQPTIPPRYGHSMVLEPRSNTLFVFAGQREERYLSDMHAYDIGTNTSTEVFSDYTSSGGPEPCFTQRAVLDPDLKEIYVFCGLSRQPNGSQLVIQSRSPNWMYRYPFHYASGKGRWTKICPTSAPVGVAASSEPEEEREPKPRYAHQVVYDRRTRTVYMHGGNAGIREERDGPGQGERDEEDRDVRLDDFWRMNLERMPSEEVVRRCLGLVRRQQFKEMCENDSAVSALNFLRESVAAVVDHENSEEEREFRSLLAHLVTQSPAVDSDMAIDSESRASGRGSRHEDPDTSSEQYRQRMQVFERLLPFVNAEAKQPEGELVNLVDKTGEEA